MVCFSIFMSDGSVEIRSAHTAQLAMNDAKREYPDRTPLAATMTGNKNSIVY